MSHTFDFDLILKNGTIVTASDEVECEVGCKDGKVLMLGLNLPVPEGCKVIDVAGGYITVRNHTKSRSSSHFRSLTHSYFETSQRSQAVWTRTVG